MATPSKPKKLTHVVARTFKLSEIELKYGDELDLSDGILRLPSSAILFACDRGLLIPQDSLSLAKAAVEKEYTQTIEAAQTESSKARNEIQEEYGRQLGEMSRLSDYERHAAKRALDDTTKKKNIAAHDAHHLRLEEIERGRLAKLSLVEEEAKTS